eukprot:TRINITY_DN6310_c0_g1_i1.p3 TRINITY_DN6310_c0_g1~~TRINITY_DN6310_c0_g1_i1.p3  ORF type:complete len:114 (-),score=34.68 TRINITY_DN6310_c0_g1_i1:435-776(-)
MSVWVYMNAAQYQDAILLHNGRSSSNGVGLVVRSSPHNRLAVLYPPSTVVASTYSVPLQTWVYLSAVSSSGLDWQLFENGRLVDTVVMPKSAVPPAEKFSAGAGCFGERAYWS